jgi:transcriptional regulator with XRE-family HTH domain
MTLSYYIILTIAIAPRQEKCVYFFVSFCIVSGVIPIGAVLKALRARKGLSLRRLGEEVGISFNTLSAYERNFVQPTIENCFKLSRFFEVPMEYFILGEDADMAFRDADLLSLFHGVDALPREERNLVKRYMRKYLKAKQTLVELAAQAEGESEDEERKRQRRRRKTSE